MKETEPAVPANASRVSRLARASLILGGGSILLLGVSFILARLGPHGSWSPVLLDMLSFVVGLAAVVLAAVANYRIRRLPELLQGRSHAQIGYWTGMAGACLVVLLYCPDLFLNEHHTDHRKGQCISNLHQLDGAKEQWALANHKTAKDTPAMTDLAGTDKYVPWPLSCPLGGTYTLNTLSNKPTCTVSDHTL
ncbi:MAG: hypothetical protein WCO56_10410 [Verrucomicrobiota bacterium]